MINYIKNSLKKWVRMEVSKFIFTPDPSCILDNAKDKLVTVKINALTSCDTLNLSTNEGNSVPSSRDSEYKMQGIVKGLGESKEDVKLLVYFIVGKSGHIFYPPAAERLDIFINSLKKIEGYDKMGEIIGVQFNHFGVLNDYASRKPLSFTPTDIAQEDIVSDSLTCLKATMNTYKNAQVIVVGHSFGGIIAPPVVEAILNDDAYKNRLLFAHICMSLESLSGAFDYMLPSTILGKAVPNSFGIVLKIIDYTNTLFCSVFQKLLKNAVIWSGWPKLETKDNIKKEYFRYVNLLTDDQIIPDQERCVKSYSLNSRFVYSRKSNAHEFLQNNLNVVNHKGDILTEDESDLFVEWSKERLSSKGL